MPDLIDLMNERISACPQTRSVSVILNIDHADVERMQKAYADSKLSGVVAEHLRSVRGWHPSQAGMA